MKDKLVFCSIITKNRLAYAKVLYNSLKKFHRNAQMKVLLIDKPNEYFNKKEIFFDLVALEVLKIPKLMELSFKYNAFEFTNSLKPRFIKYLFKKGYKKVIYLDSDILIMSSFENIFKYLQKYSIILTPHITSQIKDKNVPNEMDFLNFGIFNGGFLAVKNDNNSKIFIDWWNERLADYCIYNLRRGLYVDQKWLNYIPSLFANYLIIKDPRYNVAYWNLHERKVKNLSGNYCINNKPIVFFHFSGFDTENPYILSKYQTRFSVNQLKNLKPLITNYKKRLLDAGYEKSSKWKYSYDYFENGEPITKSHRDLYFHQILKFKNTNPFSTGPESFYYYYKNRNHLFNKAINLIERIFLRLYNSNIIQENKFRLKDLVGNNVATRLRNWEKSKNMKV